MDKAVIARLLSMSSFDHLNVLIKAKDEDLLALNDILTMLPQTVIEGTAHAELYQSVVTEIYGRWVAQSEDVAVKEEKQKHFKHIRDTIGLLNSMVEGGEKHSETSREYVDKALTYCKLETE